MKSQFDRDIEHIALEQARRVSESRQGIAYEAAEAVALAIAKSIREE